MIAPLKSGLRRTRFALVAIAAALFTALIITPAHAAVGLIHLEGGTIAAVVIVATFAFALALELSHLARHRSGSHRGGTRHG